MGRVANSNAQLAAMPAQVERDLAAFAQKNPKASKHLQSIRPKDYCQAYLPKEAHLHGNVTSNNVESFNYMAIVVRQANDLFSSLLAMVMLNIRRHHKIYASIPERVMNDDDGFDETTPATRRAFELLDKRVKNGPLLNADIAIVDNKRHAEQVCSPADILLVYPTRTVTTSYRI